MRLGEDGHVVQDVHDDSTVQEVPDSIGPLSDAVHVGPTLEEDDSEAPGGATQGSSDPAARASKESSDPAAGTSKESSDPAAGAGEESSDSAAGAGEGSRGPVHRRIRYSKRV